MYYRNQIAKEKQKVFWTTGEVCESYGTGSVNTSDAFFDLVNCLEDSW